MLRLPTLLSADDAVLAELLDVLMMTLVALYEEAKPLKLCLVGNLF